MPHIFAGADRQQIDPEVLDAFKDLPDDFWVFAEFTISRNIDWFIIHPHQDGTLALIVIELKRTTLPLSGDINNAWRQWTPEGWRDLALSGPYRNYYWQAVEAANKLKEWLWNNQRRFRLGQDLLNQDAFKIWPDLLILSPAGITHQLPLHPPNNFGKFLFSLPDCLRHITTWRSRQLSLVPLVEEELYRLAEALGLTEICPGQVTTAPPQVDLLTRVQLLEQRVQQLEARLGDAPTPPVRKSHDERIAPRIGFADTGVAPTTTAVDEMAVPLHVVSKEIAFGWVEEVLRQHGPRRPLRLADLGNSLKSRHNFDARLQLGQSLTELLGELARAGRVRLSYRDRVPYAVLAGDEAATVAAEDQPMTPLAPREEEASATGEPISVRQRLGREGLMMAVRVIAAVEDHAHGRVVQTASFLKHLRESLPLNDIASLSNGEANRLLREELVELDYLRTTQVQDIDLATGDLCTTEGYLLNREHPTIKIILAQGAPTLKDTIEVRVFPALSEEAPAAG
jgi:hypothetical protein